MKFLVLDVGGSAIKYALMDDNANLIEKGSVVTPKDTFENFRETIGSIYDQYKDQIEGIAMSMPGQLDSDRGYAISGGALLYNYEVEMVKLLQERCPVNITIENDGKCAALGELWQGGLKGCKDGLVVVIGTGLGGGIIIDGKLHKGKHFFAGEFSGVVINNNDLDSPPSYVERSWAVQNGVRGLLYPIADAKGIERKEMTGQLAFELINNGDEDANKVFDKYCYSMAVQLYNLQNLFDAEKIAIGGGISAQPILIENIRRQIDNHAQFLHTVSAKPTYVKPDVVLCELGNDANLVGALYSYMVRYKLTPNL